MQNKIADIAQDNCLQSDNNERIDRVNYNITLIQKKSGLTFGTDALLLAGYIKGGQKLRGAELGGGSGIISLLLCARNKLKTVTVFEIQEEYAELCRRNIQANSFDNRIVSVCKDIRSISLGDVSQKALDVVFTNPPYMKSDSGKHNNDEGKNIARHEIFGGIEDFCLAASKLLRCGGAFYAVYLPERLCDLFSAMRNADIEPKRLTFVCPMQGRPPCLVLCEGKKSGKSGLTITKNLNIKENGAESAEYSYIMQNGEFDDSFKTRH